VTQRDRKRQKRKKMNHVLVDSVAGYVAEGDMKDGGRGLN
jgi:hypothetical protein